MLNPEAGAAADLGTFISDIRLKSTTLSYVDSFVFFVVFLHVHRDDIKQSTGRWPPTFIAPSQIYHDLFYCKGHEATSHS